MKNLLLFVVCICISGIVSLIMGQDVGIDLLNYHLYIPYAFLHHRLGTDLIAAGPVHTFFNPLPDIPYFLLFYYLNDWPRLTAFLKAVYSGIILFTLCKWVPLLFKGKSWQNKVLKIALICFALTGLGALLQVGFASNEELMTCFAVIGAYLLFRGTDGQLHFRLKHILLATFLVSFATGLKYTAAPAACGVGLCCLFLLIKNKSSFKAYLAVMGTALGGFLLTNGYFLWQKWHLFGNPLFPFFNHIFKSPFFPAISLPNSTLTPHTWQEYLFLPLLRLNYPDFGEYRLDFRLLLGLISFVILAVSGLVFYIKKRRALSKNYLLLIGLFTGTYIPWIILFGNTRYSILLEILSCFLFTRILLIKRASKMLVSVLLLLFSIYSAFFVQEAVFKVQRQSFAKRNITFSQEVVVPDDALVIVAGHYSALVPFLNPKAQYMGGIQFVAEKLHASHGDVLSVQFFHPKDYYRHNFPIREKIKNHQGPIYLLVPFLYWVWGEDFWKDYGLDTKTHYCQVFDTNLTHYKYRMALCKVNKSPAGRTLRAATLMR